MFKKFLAAMAVLMMLVVGFGAATAPAQAAPVSQSVSPMDYGTYVRYYGCVSSSGSCTGWHIRVWTMNGAHNYLFQGERARNVRDVCPADSNHRIAYMRPGTTTWVGPFGYGECRDFQYAVEGQYEVVQYD